MPPDLLDDGKQPQADWSCVGKSLIKLEGCGETGLPCHWVPWMTESSLRLIGAALSKLCLN